MAEGTTTPRRTRAASTAKAPAKASAAKPATPKAETATASEPLKVELHHVGDTKQYAKFEPSADLRGTVVGSIYAPLGTQRVLVAIVPGEEAPAAE